MQPLNTWNDVCVMISVTSDPHLHAASLIIRQLSQSANDIVGTGLGDVRTSGQS